MGCLGPHSLQSILPTKALEWSDHCSFSAPSKDLFRNIFIFFCFLRSNKVLADLQLLCLFCLTLLGKKYLLNGHREFSGSHFFMDSQVHRALLWNKYFFIYTFFKLNPCDYKTFIVGAVSTFYPSQMLKMLSIFVTSVVILVFFTLRKRSCTLETKVPAACISCSYLFDHQRLLCTCRLKNCLLFRDAEGLRNSGIEGEEERDFVHFDWKSWPGGQWSVIYFEFCVPVL